METRNSLAMASRETILWLKKQFQNYLLLICLLVAIIPQDTSVSIKTKVWSIEVSRGITPQRNIHLECLGLEKEFRVGKSKVAESSSSPPISADAPQQPGGLVIWAEITGIPSIVDEDEKDVLT